MKLFKIEIERDNPLRRGQQEGRELVVHAEEEEDARAHVGKKFTGWRVVHLVEIVGEAHFTIALLEP